MTLARWTDVSAVTCAGTVAATLFSCLPSRRADWLPVVVAVELGLTPFRADFVLFRRHTTMRTW